eukprot:scaffold38838_cov89-Cyclotella_meneghiniana.AAC.1
MADLEKLAVIASRSYLELELGSWVITPKLRPGRETYPGCPSQISIAAGSSLPSCHNYAISSSIQASIHNN